MRLTLLFYHFKICMPVSLHTDVLYGNLRSWYSVLIGADLPMFFQGRQEDAEEYLGFTLNGLHEEMLALKKLISPQEESKHLFLP